MRQVVLDTETTGLRPGRIVEIGCVEINDRTIGKHFHRLINPQEHIGEEVTRIHGISNEMVQDQPTFKDIWKPLLAFIQGSELIIHNAPFDLSFLDAEVQKIGIPSILKVSNCKVHCTLKAARSKHPKVKNNLDALSDRYAINRDQRKDRHGALIDAEILAQVYLAMTSS